MKMRLEKAFQVHFRGGGPVVVRGVKVGESDALKHGQTAKLRPQTQTVVYLNSLQVVGGPKNRGGGGMVVIDG